jgi:hypothetical protein
MLSVETDPNSNIKTAEDAIWWTITTITTVGYGDRYPVTTAGRIIGMIVMVSGVGLFGTYTAYIASLLPSDIKIRKDQAIDDNHRHLKFGAIIPYHKKVTLVNHVTGTSDYYFRNSIARSNMGFELLKNSTFDMRLIREIVTMINDQAIGYNSEKIAPIIDLARDKIGSKIVFWSQKDMIRELMYE